MISVGWRWLRNLAEPRLGPDKLRKKQEVTVIVERSIQPAVGRLELMPAFAEAYPSSITS